MARPRKPTPLKLLQGTFEPTRENPNEPILPAEVPVAPDFLKGEARKEWDSMSEKLMGIGCISLVDKACFAGYCQMYGRWIEIEKQLADESLVIKTSKDTTMANPLVAMANNTYKILQKALVEFGMTPVSRSRVSVPKKDEKKKDEWSDMSLGNPK